jgi:ketosteroid isomerase-like protein
MPTSFEADAAAIEALNLKDASAVLNNDIGAITAQWTDDFVVIPSTGAIVRGRTSNVRVAEQGREQIAALEPLEYSTAFEEITIAGDYAFEWGTFRGKSRHRSSGHVLSYSGKLMRILQRQHDGSWKMHRTMVSTDPPGSTPPQTSERP